MVPSLNRILVSMYKKHLECLSFVDVYIHTLFVSKAFTVSHSQALGRNNGRLENLLQWRSRTFLIDDVRLLKQKCLDVPTLLCSISMFSLLNQIKFV